jgi:hypothetical protein
MLAHISSWLKQPSPGRRSDSNGVKETSPNRSVPGKKKRKRLSPSPGSEQQTDSEQQTSPPGRVCAKRKRKRRTGSSERKATVKDKGNHLGFIDPNLTRPQKGSISLNTALIDLKTCLNDSGRRQEKKKKKDWFVREEGNGNG